MSRFVLLAALGVLAAPLGAYVGVNSGFSAVVALALTMTGVAAARAGTRAGWLVYATLAGGQALVLVLVVTGAIADDARTPVVVPGHPMWHHVLAHAGLQGLYLGAFAAGLALGRRLQSLRAELEAATRDAATRDALVEEARDDYARALELAREKPAAVVHVPVAPIPSDPDGDTEVRPPPIDEPTAPTDPLPIALSKRERERARVEGQPSLTPDTDEAWSAAYLAKIAAQQRGAIALCALGIALLAVIGREPMPRYLGMGCMGGIVVVLAATRRRAVYWPWILAGALSVGPAYSFGLDSGFAAVMVPLLFAGGLFRGRGRGASHRRTGVLLAVCGTHALWFTLILTGALPDDGNVPVLVPFHARFEPHLLHLLQQLVYIGAFIAGQSIDRRLQAAVDGARAAGRQAARQDAVLTAMRGDLDRLLRGGGIFTGATVGGYQVGPLLGRGGMGEVYEARAGDQRIALKLVRPDQVAAPDALARFAGEASVLERVRSDHVARVLASGGARDALPFIAMEYVGGESLAARLRDRGPQPAPALVGLVGDIAAGLRDVHAAGVVHLDVKPSNIILTTVGGQPRWKLVDFGVARLLAGPGALVERPGGTPQYMAPEQAAGERIDTRSDLYALALVVYRALVGRPAFTATRAPRDPRHAGPLADDLVLFLRIGLAGAPAERFATAGELAAAFSAAAAASLPDGLRARARAQLAREPWR